MLDLTLWQDRLNSAQTDLKKVGLAASIPEARKNLKQDPAAFFIPVSDRAGANAFGNAVHQTVTIQIGVLIAIKHAGAITGKKNIDELTVIRKQIDSVLLAWEPADATDMVIYSGGRLIGFNDQVLWYQDIYQTTYDRRKV